MKRCDQCGEMMFYAYGGVYRHDCPPLWYVVGDQDINNRNDLNGDLTGLTAYVYADNATEAAEKYVEERWVDLDYCKINVCYVRQAGSANPWCEVTVEAEQTVVFHGSIEDPGYG
jgi:hypothetical protein